MDSQSSCKTLVTPWANTTGQNPQDLTAVTRNLSGKSLWHTHNSCGINACFILGDLNAKVGSQQDGYITGKYGLTKETVTEEVDM